MIVLRTQRVGRQASLHATIQLYKQRARLQIEWRLKVGLEMGVRGRDPLCAQRDCTQEYKDRGHRDNAFPNRDIWCSTEKCTEGFTVVECNYSQNTKYYLSSFFWVCVLYYLDL